MRANRHQADAQRRDVSVAGREEERDEEKLEAAKETVTTYTNKKDWSDRPVDSSDFSGAGRSHEPRRASPSRRRAIVASKVTLGGFTRRIPVVQRLDQHTGRPRGSVDLASGTKGKVAPSGAGYYMGANPQSPQVGDVRIAFKAVKGHGQPRRRARCAIPSRRTRLRPAIRSCS